MVSYYFRLALISFRRNMILSMLMVAAIALGVSMTMTAFTVLYVMSHDPIPGKSDRLFAVQLDNGGPASRKAGDVEPPAQLTYRDAMALLDAHAATRQVAMHQISLMAVPADRNLKPFSISARATSADFFPMFEVPMLFGRSWSTGDDARKIAVVVLSRKLNERLFGGSDSVGKSIELGGIVYQIVGVMGRWEPLPRFYDVIGGQDFDEGEDAYLPLSQTIEHGISTAGYEFCDAGPPGETFDDLLRSECVWNQFWVELPGQAEARRYRDFLANYARDQQRSGRFNWAPNVRLRNVRDWLVAQKVVPDDARLSVLVAFGFFAICLVSTLGLMLAKLLGRTGEFSVRRALGATRSDIFVQVLVEAGVTGLLGGLSGLCLTQLGLWTMRVLFPDGLGQIARMDTSLFATTIVIAVAATIIAGLYPAWRSMRVAPALQLKVG